MTAAGGIPAAARGPGTWSLAIGGGLAMFLVQPPADLWPLAWLAPLPWLALVRRPALAGRRPWLAAWCGGLAYWLPAIHWLRLPHPATSVGWVLLAAYLACYLPLFLAAARRLVHRWGWPLVPAAAVAWMGCDVLRGWLLGGFTLASLGHSQWRWTALIQAADAVGDAGIGGIVMAGAAGLAAAPDLRGGGAPRRSAAVEAFWAVTIVAASLAYGQWRLATAPEPTARLDALLVQGSIDTELKQDPAAAAGVLAHYDALTVAGIKPLGPAGPPEVIVWPETMWRWSLVEIDPAESLSEADLDALLGPAADGGATSDRQARGRAAVAAQRLAPLAAYARGYGACWIVGVDRQHVAPAAAGGVRFFNSALVLDAAGRVLGRYDKMHPVMFGEYVPLADRFPVLQRLTPLPVSLTAGTGPLAVTIAGFEVAPTICYETALPWACRGLVRDLAAAGRRPDVIVNLTNDGWFWGSSELDMHLVAAIFRAVETRTPVLVAANTGFSAAIDGSGRLLARGPRRATASLRVAVGPDGRWSPWLAAGTLPAAATGVVVAVLALEWFVTRRLAPAPASGRQS